MDEAVSVFQSVYKSAQVDASPPMVVVHLKRVLGCPGNGSRFSITNSIFDDSGSILPNILMPFNTPLVLGVANQSAEIFTSGAMVKKLSIDVKIENFVRRISETVATASKFTPLFRL